jgi:DNA repair protein RadA/Sms
MPKSRTRTLFSCQQCGAESPKWLGRCPDCGAWNSYVETVVAAAPARALNVTGALARTEVVSLDKVAGADFARITVPIAEFDRVLGGGIVPGSLLLIGGDPGIGKSTLLLTVSALLADALGRVLYVSGEESVEQIKMRADRLDLRTPNLLLLAETNLETVLEQIERTQARVVVIDSIQTMYLEELTSAAGSVSQVRDCAVHLQRVAKARGLPVFLVGHVTKEGAIAGPRVLEHIVDAVLYLEGERFHAYRLLRGVKNRFGSTNEVGVFEMTDTGLVGVDNPSRLFLAERPQGAAGSVVAATLEGTRPLLVEIQALTSSAGYGLARRTANGLDLNRLHMLSAVLTKRLGMNLSHQDIIVNVVGGLRVGEPAADLAVATAIASSFRDWAVPADLVAIGEVGLSGELRTVSQQERRLAEAAKLGFKRAIAPRTGVRGNGGPGGIDVTAVDSVEQALEAIRP